MSLFSESELFRVGLNMRKQLGRPQIIDITTVVADTVGNATIQINQLVDGHQPKDQIRKFRDAIKGELTSLTPAYVSARYIESIVVPMNQAAFQGIEEGSDKGKVLAATVLDLASGFHTTVAAVLLAHKPDLFSAKDLMAEYNRGVIEMSEADFLRIIGYRQRQIVKIANLLATDPTGYSVVDWQVSEFKTFEQNKGGWIKPFRVPEFVIAGAELARNTYRKIYPTTENLFKTK